jgi:hypothetical protein
MNQLWLVNYKTDVGFPLVEEVLVYAQTVQQARNRIGMFIEECNATCDEIEIYDYYIASIEPYDEATHGPQHFFEIINCP